MGAADKISGKYFSDQVNVIDKLYAPCLKWATRYVRDAGYFSSHVYQAMSKQILDFVLRDKKNHITLVTCIDVYPSDFDAIVASYSKSEEQVFNELRAMLEDDVLANPVKMLAAIVASKQMTVYVSLRKRVADTPHSIDHSKSGYFSDGSRLVAFDGSINETYPAVVPGLEKGNKEHFNIYSKEEISEEAWDMYAAPIKKRLDDDCYGFFPKEAGKGTIIVEINSIPREQLPAVSDKDWDPENHKERAAKRSHELYEEFEKKLKKYDEVYQNDKLSQSTETDQILFSEPPIDIPGDLYDHQKRGLKCWREAGGKGILEHATGSGKTITAIAAIKEHVDAGNNAIVLVPSEHLLFQWHEEIEKFIPHATIGMLGGGEKDEGILNEMRYPREKGTILISIIHSFRSDKVQRKLVRLLSTDQNMFLVVDECHRIGAPSYYEICQKEFPLVLGLSATPDVEGRPEYNERIRNLLGSTLDEYTLKNALKDGHLSPFEYHIRTTHLTKKEQEEYDELRSKMKQGLVMLNHGEPLTEYLEVLIYKSRGIIRGAENKIPVAVELLKSEFQEGQHWLIYCDNENMMNELAKKIKRATGINPRNYWSGMNRFERKSELDFFKRNGGVIIAIKCLDEGVDIPAISHGIVLSSSKTKREWIQRRGRLLRKSEGKDKSVIHDVLALPSSSGEELSFVADEVKRAQEFSESCINSITVTYDIAKICREYNINLDEVVDDREDFDE